MYNLNDSFMRKCISLILLVLVVTAPHRAAAWGKKGHQMVANIGFSMLDSNTQAIVKKYLGNISVSDAGSWMDDVRSVPEYKHMKSWHFTNLDKGVEYKPSDKEDIVNELNIAIGRLRHRETLTDNEIQLNILILFHLTGDIAQPLHVGYGNDVGGNIVEVTFLSKQSNLHKVWDGDIIENQHITADNCMALQSTITDEQLDAIKVSDPVAWLHQSRGLLDRVYNFKDGAIDNAYILRNKVVVEKQILYAGIRLAATLEEVFKVPARPVGRFANVRTHGADTVILDHTHYRSHFVSSTHIPWIVEYTLRAEDVNCVDKVKRKDNFAPDPLNREATDLAADYKGSGYDRGHNMPAADNACHGVEAMTECFYFSNMFPQTHRLNGGVWAKLEDQERTMAAQDDSIYVWIGSYGIDKKIGPKNVVVPKFCWKVIYDYKTRQWSQYIFPNTTTVTGKPADFQTTLEDIKTKSGFDFK